jgi:hypothetical protein
MDRRISPLTLFRSEARDLFLASGMKTVWFSSDRSQRLIQIGEDIVHVLDPDGNSYHAVGNSNLSPHFLAYASVRHRRRMRNQRLDPSERLGETAHLHLA